MIMNKKLRTEEVTAMAIGRIREMICAARDAEIARLREVRREMVASIKAQPPHKWNIVVEYDEDDDDDSSDGGAPAEAVA